MTARAGIKRRTMNRKTVLITGSAGLVGSYLTNVLMDRYKTIGVERQQEKVTPNTRLCDLSDSRSWKRTLEEINPDIVIHCAALTWVDYCEEHQAETDKNNVSPVKTLVSWAAKRTEQPQVIFISSDYVYDGVHPPFDESSLINPLNYYAKSKVKGEKLVATLQHHLILRPGVIYGWHPEGTNFFMQTWKSLSEGKPMKVVDDQISNPTYVETFARAIGQCVDEHIEGVYVATGLQALSRYDFALLIAKGFGFDSKLISRAKTSDFPIKAKRPMNCETRSVALQTKLGWPFPTIDATFDTIKKKIQNV
jgi:dTDP-4-dehydrorhamnose reductase